MQDQDLNQALQSLSQWYHQTRGYAQPRPGHLEPGEPVPGGELRRDMIEDVRL